MGSSIIRSLDFTVFCIKSIITITVVLLYLTNSIEQRLIRFINNCHYLNIIQITVVKHGWQRLNRSDKLKSQHISSDFKNKFFNFFDSKSI